MKKLLLIIGFVCAAAFQGCQSHVTLEPSGAYSDASLAVTDQAILDASHAMSGFLTWYAANQTFLSKWPEVGIFAAKVGAQKDGWIRDAYAARDAYASASVAYKQAKLDSAGLDTKRAQLNAALALLTNITQQITTYKAAHNG